MGGGLAGIQAALAAADQGAEVSLVERQRRLGGATWSFQRNGLWFDNGQHVFLGCCSAYISFLDRLGVSDLVCRQRRLDVPIIGKRRARLWRAPLPPPLHLAGCLAAYRPLPLRKRLAAARQVLAVGRLDPDEAWVDQLSFGEFLASLEADQEVITGLWEPIIRPTCNLPVAEVSAAMAAKVVRTGLLESSSGADLGWAKVPLGQLHGEAAQSALERAGVEVLLGARVERLGAGDEGIGVHFEGGFREADALIVAIPHHQLADLGYDRSGIGGFEGLGSSPIVNVHLVLDRRVVDWPVWASLEPPLEWVFDHTEAAGAKEGQVLVVSLSAADRWIAMRPAEIISAIWEALREVLPRAEKASLRDAVVTKERWATFRAGPGSQKLRPPPEAGLGGVFLAGAWTRTGWPATMEGAIRSGLAAAQAALSHLGAKQAKDLGKEAVA